MRTVILPHVPVSFLLTVVLLGVQVAYGAFGLEIGLAGLYQYNPGGTGFENTDISSDLYRSLRLADTYGALVLKRAGRDYIPKSVLEAAGLCERENINLLLYGFLKVSGGYYDLEVKLFDAEAGEIKRIFYSKAGLDEYENLVEVMTDRIIAYFYKESGTVKRNREVEKEHGVMEFSFGLGYWFPSVPWAGPLMGLGSIYACGSLIPADPLFNLEIFEFALGYGFSAGYSPGINREGYENFLFHILRFGFPVALSVRWYIRNRLVLQLSPGMELDFLVQDRKYGSRETEKSAALFVSGSLGYEYMFSGKCFSAGGRIRFNGTFYNTFFCSLESLMYLRYRFAGKGGG